MSEKITPIYYDVKRDISYVKVEKKVLWFIKYEHRVVQGMVKELTPPAKQIFDSLLDHKRWQIVECSSSCRKIRDKVTNIVFVFSCFSFMDQLHGNFRTDKGYEYFDKYEETTLALAAKHMLETQREEEKAQYFKELTKAYVK